MIDEKGKKKLKEIGRCTINTPNPEITNCPSCNAPFKRNSFVCRKCGAERDFEYLEKSEEF